MIVINMKCMHACMQMWLQFLLLCRPLPLYLHSYLSIYLSISACQRARARARARARDRVRARERETERERERQSERARQSMPDALISWTGCFEAKPKYFLACSWRLVCRTITRDEASDAKSTRGLVVHPASTIDVFRLITITSAVILQDLQSSRSAGLKLGGMILIENRACAERGDI